ncbi:MAG: hypothetical protein ACK5VW_08050, partial [Holosporales bacterium]
CNAWAEADRAQDILQEGREDLPIFSLALLEREGGVPLLTVTTTAEAVEKVGVNAAFVFGLKSENAVSVQFLGRLATLPRLLEPGLVEVVFQAQSGSCMDALDEIVQRLQQRPEWSPYYSKSETDGSSLFEVLESTPHHVYWPRHNLEVRLSGLLSGSSSLSFTTTELPSPVRLAMVGTPLGELEVRLRAQWLQGYEGLFELGPLIAARFPGGMMHTLTPQHLLRSWWQTGQRLGRSGYWVEEASLTKFTPPLTGGLNLYPQMTQPLRVAPEDSLNDPQKPRALQRLPKTWLRPKLRLGWRLRQPRVETLSLKLTQRLISPMPLKLRHKKLSMTLQNLGEHETTPHWRPGWGYGLGQFVIHGGQLYSCLTPHISRPSFTEDAAFWRLYPYRPRQVAILRSGSFFRTGEGRKALLHAVTIAKVHLLASRRCLRATFELPEESFWQVNVDQRMSLFGPDLPGGRLLGKVVEVKIILDGITNQRRALVTLACCLESEKPAEKTYVPLPSYGQEGVLAAENSAADAQEIEHLMHQLESQALDDPLQLPEFLGPADLIETLTILNSSDQQEAYLKDREYPKSQNLTALLRDVPTEVEIRLRSLRPMPQIHTHYECHLDMPAFSAEGFNFNLGKENP